MKIIDCHHHYWDPRVNPHPWLTDRPMIPFRYGDYSAICRPWLPEDHARAAAGWDLVASITMEGEWSPADPLGEARWLARLAQEQGTPAAHVGQIWLDRDDCAKVLDGYATLPLTRSVRHKPRSTPRPGMGPGGLADPAYLAGVAALARTPLMFDLQCLWWHLADLARLREVAPDLPVIVNHTGLPADRSPEALAGWRAALEQAAGMGRVYLKISGLGLPGRPWRLEDNRDIIRTAIDIFGPDRAMFGSNFPVDGLCGSFDTIFSGFDAATRDYGAAERAALFHGTAARVYGLDPV